MIQVLQKDKTAETYDAKKEETTLSNMAARMSSQFINDLYQRANVVDERYLFF